MKVEIKPEMLRWARERAGFSLEDLAPRFPQLAAWEQQGCLPDVKANREVRQVHLYADRVSFLPRPPVEQIPIPDFRTMDNEFAGTRALIC
jgi:transcriptional regulator with XRE-family HTH domain